MRLGKIFIRIFKFFLISVIAFLIFFVLFREHRAKQYELKTEISELETEVKSLENENRLLKKELEGVNSLEFIEKVAREDYGMVKPGELVYIDINRGSKLKPSDSKGVE